MIVGRGMFFLVAVLAASPAFSQAVSPLEPPPTSRYLKWGPLWARPGLTIPTLGYDSNVFYRPDGSLLPQVGDYFIALSPRLQGMVLFGHRAFLTFDERLEFYLYAKQTDVNYFNQLGKMRLTVPFRSFGLYADAGYDRVRDRPIDAQDQRPIRKETPLGVGAIVKVGWRTDAELGFTHLRATAEDPDEILGCTPGVDPGCFSLAQRNDRTERGTRLLLTGSRRRIEFDDEAVGRDGREWRYGSGVDFGIGGKISGTLRAGYAHFDLSDPAAVDYRGIVGDIALAVRLGGQGSRLTLRGLRDVRYTLYESTPLYRYGNMDATLVKYFNRLLGMEAGIGRGTVTYLGDPENRVDDLLMGSVGVRVRLSENDIGRRVEYAFRYIRTRRDSTNDALDQNRGTIGFGVSFGY